MFGKRKAFADRDGLAEDLIQEGWHALELEDHRAALKVARRLRLLGNSGAFEIEARARWTRGDRRGAIRTLKRGLLKFPHVAILWSFLGEFYSNSGQYELALNAFERASRGHGGHRELADFNIALVLWRQGRCEESLFKLNLVPPATRKPPASAVEELRAQNLMTLGRVDEALTAVEDALALADAETPSAAMARMYSVRAEAKHAKGEDTDALESARRAVLYDKANAEATTLIRVLRGERSPQAKEWHLMLHGRWHEKVAGDLPIPEFFATYFIIAETVDQALAFARDFEPEPVGPSLEVETCRVVAATTEELLGVKRAHGGYTYFHVDATGEYLGEGRRKRKKLAARGDEL